MNKGSSYFLVSLFFTVSLCVSAGGQEIGPENALKRNESVKIAQIRSELDLIHFGDLIEIDVVGSAEFDWRGTLTPEGFLEQLSFIDQPVFGLCRSEQEIAETITPLFGKILRDPQISVKVLDRSNRPVAIISGAVKTPQRLQIKRSIRLNELLVISGGLNDTASGEIQIFRPSRLNCLAEAGEQLEVDAPQLEQRERFVAASEVDGSQFINVKISDLLAGDAEANPRILSGDIVTVQEAQPIYVIGGVEAPRQVASRSQMTLSRAIASAGGLSKDADSTNVSIYRREGAVSEVIRANLEKIRTNEEADVLLKTYDIIEVPVKGRSAKESAPVVSTAGLTDQERLKLPLRVID